MSEQPDSKVMPKSPKEVIVEWLASLDLGSDVDERIDPDLGEWAGRLLMAFEEHDIDLSWQPYDEDAPAE